MMGQIIFLKNVSLDQKLFSNIRSWIFFSKIVLRTNWFNRYTSLDKNVQSMRVKPFNVFDLKRKIPNIHVSLMFEYVLSLCRYLHGKQEVVTLTM